MKKSIKSIICSAIVTCSLTTTVLATKWYFKDNLILPRFGSWISVERSANSGSQGTRVTANKYDVNGRIVKIDPRTKKVRALSDYITHQDTENSAYATVYEHDTGVKSGTLINAEFKTSVINYKTTTCQVGWRP